MKSIQKLKLSLLSGMLLSSINAFAQNESLTHFVATNDLQNVKTHFSDSEAIKVDDASGLRPLQLAAKMGYTDIVAFLIEKEPLMETGIYIEYGEKPAMIHAIEQGNVEVIKVMFDKGARDANNRWMGKTYLFHAYDLNASNEVISTLKQYGSKEELAQKDQKQVSDIADVNTITESLNIDLFTHFNFSKYQNIDVHNVNMMAAQMIYEFNEKYADNVTAIANERAKILTYRNKKLYKLLTKPQQSVFNNLFKQ